MNNNDLVGKSMGVFKEGVELGEGSLIRMH
jgi:hypothetical protein